MFWKKKTKLTYREQRNNVQTSLAKAIADNNFAEMARLEGNLHWLDKQIAKEKKC